MNKTLKKQTTGDSEVIDRLQNILEMEGWKLSCYIVLNQQSSIESQPKRSVVMFLN